MIKYFPWILLLQFGSLNYAAQSLSIGNIQGAAHQSPHIGKEIITQGVVTRVHTNGFYLQSLQPDSSPETSDAIYVVRNDTKVGIGNELQVTGTVEEWIPGGSGSNNQSLTQITATKIERIRNKATLPKPVNLNYLMPSFPKAIKQPGSSFDTGMNALDFWESMEHMRVLVMDTTVIGPRSKYSEIAVRVPEYSDHPTTSRGGVKLTGYDSNAARIFVTIPKENEEKFSTGDRIPGVIQGILSYSFGNYKITGTIKIPNPLPGKLPPIAPFSIPSNALTVATFNIENLYLDLPDEKFQSIARAITQTLKEPDIIALQEVHDNTGPSDNGVVGANEVLEKLILFIEKEGGPRYSFHQLNPGNNEDGGWPGANIRNAYLYNQKFVSLGRSYLLQDTAFDKNEVTGFTGTRKPLVGFFRHRSREIIYINCHLKSKGGDSSPYGSLLPAVRFTERQRIGQTRVIRDHVEDLQKKYPKADIIVLGDMNDFEFSPAMENLTRGNGLINLIDKVPPSERYTYIFQGYSQVLDHILATPHLAKNMAATIFHVNADLSEGLRGSDHDPVLAWVQKP